MAKKKRRPDRVRLGVTFLAVLRAARELLKNSDFAPTSRREFAEKILEKILGKKLPQAMKDQPKIDWDAILEFIEKLIPLILLIIDAIS